MKRNALRGEGSQSFDRSLQSCCKSRSSRELSPKRQPILIRERGEIVRMRCVHYKSYERAALFLWTKDASARQFADALGCISRKLRIVLENRRAPNVLDVINRGCESDRARDVWRASLEPVRRFLERAFFERDAHDHFAAAMPWWDRIEDFSASVKHADAGRPTHLVPGKRQKIAAQFAHIDRQMSCALRRVHECKRTDCTRFLTKFGDGIDCAQGI